MLGRSRLALAESGAGAGRGAVGGRTVFDEGGGVFSKKGGVMEMAADDATGESLPRDPLSDVTKPDPPRTPKQFKDLLDQAKRDGNTEEVTRLRRERYLQQCAQKNKDPLPVDKWRSSATRAHENRISGRSAEDEALGRAGIDNNNYTDTRGTDPQQRQVQRYTDSNGISTRPDGVSDTHWVDVKSTKADVIRDSEQLQAEREGAVQEGKRQGIVIVNDNYQMTRIDDSLAGAEDTDILHFNNQTKQWRLWDQQSNAWSDEFDDTQAATVLGGTSPTSVSP